MTSPTVKIESEGRESTVSIRAASFGDAMRVAWRNYCFPPEGYRLDRAMIARRNHSGRKMTLKLVFLHVDRRAPVLTSAEVSETFGLDARVAAGEAVYPVEENECEAVTAADSGPR